MDRLKADCPHCRGQLKLNRTWTRVYLSCRSCGREYPEDKYKDLMDDYFETVLANVPCNRL